MNGWSAHEGLAVCLPTDNIDTDQLIPARFMSQPRANGYSEFLLYDLRRDKHGTLKPDFILNQQSSASVLITGKNFGSGSSREAAVYALLDSGIQVVIAESFGDIFTSNAVNNGVLPAQVTALDWKAIYEYTKDAAVKCAIELATESINIGKLSFPFEIDETWRLKIANGWDDIDLTQQHQSQIRQYAKTRYENEPWAWPTLAQK